MNYDMNTRKKFTAGLLSLGLILALLPLSANLSLTVNPQKLLTEVSGNEASYTVDQVAKFVITEDSTIQIIDLRPKDEFRSFNIPGSVNIPYNELFNSNPGSYLSNKNIKTIFYSNGDLDANYALIITRGMHFNNSYIMKGGLNEWFSTVMNSSFSGEKITARENAIFETRTRARKLFTDINSLPDSLKLKFYESRQLEARSLDGGCE
jgi:rhodanese-related sulfurtransferase